MLKTTRYTTFYVCRMLAFLLEFSKKAYILVLSCRVFDEKKCQGHEPMLKYMAR